MPIQNVVRGARKMQIKLQWLRDSDRMRTVPGLKREQRFDKQ